MNIEKNSNLQQYGIINYGEVVVKRTLNDLGNPNENNFHMISGFTSELTVELLNAIGKNDTVNIIEELGDAYWFTTGLLITCGYFNKPEYKEKISVIDSMILNLGFDWNDENYLISISEEEKVRILNNVLFITYSRVGAINTIFKNIMIQNKPKYDGEVLNEEQILDRILEILICINTLVIFTGKTIQEIREVNDKKLLKRYKGGTFTPELSINRNTDSERELMEKEVNNKK